MAIAMGPTTSGSTGGSTVRAFVRRHPVPAYYALVFAISWVGFLLAIGGPGAIPATPERFETLMPVAVLAMLAGPPVGGLLLTGLVGGGPGLRALGARLLRWRVGARWYALALLTAPLLFLAVLAPLSLLSAAFTPGVLATGVEAPALALSLAITVGAGLFEEIGWTGFVVPALRRRRGVLATGLIVGVLWAAWHWPVNVWAPAASGGALSVALLLVDPLFFMVGYRVLMVWLYDRTRSLLVAVLMHAGLTASARILGPASFAGAAGAPLLAFDLAWATVVWVLVLAVVKETGSLTGAAAKGSRA